MGHQQSKNCKGESFMTLKGGKIKKCTRYKPKRRGAIWLSKRIRADTVMSPTRERERMIWRALTKAEILQFMRNELMDQKINSKDSKLKLIRQWSEHKKPWENTLVQRRETEFQYRRKLKDRLDYYGTSVR